MLIQSKIMSELEKAAEPEYEYDTARDTPLTALERVKYMVNVY